MSQIEYWSIQVDSFIYAIHNVNLFRYEYFLFIKKLNIFIDFN